MGALDLSSIADGGLVLVDSAPIIYWLEEHPVLADRFKPLFELQSAGALELAIASITIAEVLTGPLKSGQDSVARRYRSIFESWRVIDLTIGLAEEAARLRARFKLKLADAVQVASALSVNAEALVTYDRDFGRVTSLRVIS